MLEPLDCEEEIPVQRDWVCQATAVRFQDLDSIRGNHYCRYISKLEVIELAAEAIAAGEHWHYSADRFCDQENLYGHARQEVNYQVFIEHKLLEDFFTT